MVSTLPAWGLVGSVAEDKLQVKTAIDSDIAARVTFIWFDGSALLIVLDDTGGVRWLDDITPVARYFIDTDWLGPVGSDHHQHPDRRGERRFGCGRPRRQGAGCQRRLRCDRICR